MSIFTYLKIGVLIATLVVGIGIGYKYQSGKIEKLKTDITQLESNLGACQEVNKTNVKATESLQEDVKKANKSCASRIAAKDALIKKLQEIDNLKPTGGTTSEKDSGVISPDPILDRLNKLFVPSS